MGINDRVWPVARGQEAFMLLQMAKQVVFSAAAKKKCQEPVGREWFLALLRVRTQPR